MFKNVGSQILAVYAYDTSAEAAKTGLTNITAQITKDGGTPAATNDVNPAELDATDHPGIYVFDLTQAETNADNIIISAATVTADIVIEPIQILTVLPGSSAALLADVVEVDGVTASAQNLSDTYDGTGYSDPVAPATQDQAGQIANVGAALNTPMTSYTLTTGNETANDETATEALDSTKHEHTDAAGALDLYYEFTVGGDGIAVQAEVTGLLNSSNDSLGVYAWDWTLSAWEQVGTKNGQNNTTLNIVSTFNLFAKHTGTAANLGLVRIRFFSASGLTTATLRIDQIFVAYSVVNRSVGYLEGAVWLDTNDGVAGTVNHVNGVADNSVDTIGDATIISTNIGLKKFHLLKGSNIQLVQTYVRYIFNGVGGTIDFNGQTLTFCSVFGANCFGTIAGTGRFFTRDCRYDGVTFSSQGAAMSMCSLNSAILLAASGDYALIDCYASSQSNQPTFDFQLNGSTILNLQRWSGAMHVKQMAAGDVCTITGSGDIVIDADCTGGILNLHGTFNVSDLASEAVTQNIAALFNKTEILSSLGMAAADLDTQLGNIPLLSEMNSSFATTDALIDGLTDLTAAQVNAEVDQALLDYDGPTKTEMDAAFSTTDGLITTVDTVVDAIKAVTDLLPNSGALSDLATILLDTNELQSDDVPALILASHVTTDALINGLNNLTAAQVNAQCDIALTDYDGPTNTEMLAAHATTDALVVLVDTVVDAILLQTGTNGVVLSAAQMNAVADHILRRAWATAAASSDGDTKSFRSLLGAVAKLVNKVAIAGSTLSVYEADDSTALGTQAVTDDASADPITGVDTV